MKTNTGAFGPRCREDVELLVAGRTVGDVVAAGEPRPRLRAVLAVAAHALLGVGDAQTRLVFPVDLLGAGEVAVQRGGGHGASL